MYTFSRFNRKYSEHPVQGVKKIDYRAHTGPKYCVATLRGVSDYLQILLISFFLLITNYTFVFAAVFTRN